MIGIVIINYNTWEITMECVNSIKSNCSIPFHIYIVDNKSPNGAVIKLNDMYCNDDKVTVIASKKNGGYGYGLNRGFEIALKDHCDAVVASNNDIIYKRNSLELLYAALKSDRRIAIAGAQQLSVSGKKQISAVKRPYGKLSFVFWYFPFRYHLSFLRRIEDQYLLRTKNPQEIAFPLGGCYMISSGFLSNQSLYDENIFMYSEEDIVGYKLKKNNKIAVLVPNAFVVHKHGATTGTSKAKYLLRSVPNKVYFCTHYLNMSTFEMRFHKLFYYISISIKSLYNKEFKINYGNLLKAIQ